MVVRATCARLLALATALVVGGCAVTPTAAVFAPTAAPRAEALSYFPEGAPLVALVRTDPGDPGLQRMARGGLLDGLLAVGIRDGLLYRQLRPLFGNDAAIGIPAVGRAPLAVLVTRDAELLNALAHSRVVGHRAQAAGTYRGAELFVAPDAAFAVRGDVLLVSRTTADLRRALDVHAETNGFDPGVIKRAMPDGSADALIRGVGDLRVLVVRAGARARAVPMLSALQRAGFSVRVSAGRVEAHARLDLDGAGLTERDIPITVGRTAPRAAVAGSTAPTISVRDLAHTLGALQRSAGSAAPLGLLRYQALRDALRRATKVDVDAQLVNALHGPATVMLTRRGPLLRAVPSRPDRAGRALGRLAMRANRAMRLHSVSDVRVVRGGGFATIVRGEHVLARIGVVDGVLVAGRASRHALSALARTRATHSREARGGLTFTIPAGRIPGLPYRPIRGWARASLEGLDVTASTPLSAR